VQAVNGAQELTDVKPERQILLKSGHLENDWVLGIIKRWVPDKKNKKDNPGGVWNKRRERQKYRGNSAKYSGFEAGLLLVPNPPIKITTNPSVVQAPRIQ
jgi:hypothetical protein